MTITCYIKVHKNVKSLSHVWLCDPMNCSPPGSSIHRIFQARILEWVAISFSRVSSRCRDTTPVSHIAGILFTIWDTRCLINFSENFRYIQTFSSLQHITMCPITRHFVFILDYLFHLSGLFQTQPQMSYHFICKEFRMCYLEIMHWFSVGIVLPTRWRLAL